MVKMKITNDTLYILEIEDKKMAFNSKDEVIEELEEKIEKNEDPTPFEVSELDMSKEEGWKLKGVNWRNLLLRVIKQSRGGE